MNRIFTSILAAEAMKLKTVLTSRKEIVVAMNENCESGDPSFCSALTKFTNFIHRTWIYQPYTFNPPLEETELKSLEAAVASLPDGQLKHEAQEYLKIATECILRVLEGRLIFTTTRDSQEDFDCAVDFFHSKLLDFDVPADPTFQPNGDECSKACSVHPDPFSAVSINAVAASNEICRRCLIAMFGTFNVGKGHYPTTADLEKMVQRSEIIGQAACREDEDSQDCKDYREYYTTPADISNVDDKTGEAQAYLKENKRLAIERGFEGKKLLIISSGGTFREGGNGVHAMGKPESVETQRKASESHVAFARYVKYAFGIETDFLVNTYNTAFDETLKTFYPAGTDFTFREFDKNTVRHVIFGHGIQHASEREDFPKLDEYAAVFFIRPDLYLKPGFFSYFKPFDKFTLGFLAMSFQELDPVESMNCDILLYAPHSTFEVVSESIAGSVYVFYMNEFNFKPFKGLPVGFMINTFHVTDSKQTSNPLYFIVDRPESKKSISLGLTYDDYIGNWESSNPQLSRDQDLDDESAPLSVVFSTVETLMGAVRKVERLLSK